MSFTITTTDSQYTYTAPTNDGGEVIEKWDIKHNNKASNTQGFLRKVEKGDIRVEVIVGIADTKNNINNNLLPMLTYPTNVTVTFDRNILGKTTKTGTFTFEDLKVSREFPNEEMAVEIKLVEVVS